MEFQMQEPSSKRAIEPEKECQIDVLLNEYKSDVTCSTLRWLKEHGITQKQVKDWLEERRLVFPWSTRYDSVRLYYNRLIQYFPLMLVRVRKQSDIQWALRFCHHYKAPFAIRSGAHSTAGFSASTGVIIDLMKYDRVKILSHEKGLVRVAAGARIGEVAKILAQSGLALVAGTCQNTGVGGLTLGGGLGFLTRKYGLTIDSVVELNIILANGRRVTANKESHPQLFWACCGAGNGNFGVVTSFVFQTYRIKEVVLFQLWFEKKYLKPVFEFWQGWCSTTDPSLTTELKIRNDASKPGHILIEGQGDPSPCRRKECPSPCDPTKHVEHLITPFFQWAPKVKIWLTSFADAVRHFSTPIPDMFFKYNTSFVYRPLPRKAINIIDKAFSETPPQIYISFHSFGGRVAEIGESETAFRWRKSLYWLYIRSSWKDPQLQEQLQAVNERIYLQLWPFLTSEFKVPRLYANFNAFNVGPKYGEAYWGKNYKALRVIKACYDPDNFFTSPQPIQPAKVITVE
jgi:hypothetical protein